MKYAFILAALAALGMSELAKPEKTHAPVDAEPISLDAVVPKQVGEWRLSNEIPNVALGTKPGKDLSSELYEQVLMRTYRRARDNAMLWVVVAHGTDQRADYTVHLPEMCYYALGFEVEPRGGVPMTIGGGSGEVRRLLARSPARLEPISYWVLMGDRIVAGQVNVKMRELWYGVTGQAKPGTLVRVSTPMQSGVVDDVYVDQQAFIEDFVRAWPATARHIIWPTSENYTQGFENFSRS
jgi:EpsI family protein